MSNPAHALHPRRLAGAACFCLWLLATTLPAFAASEAEQFAAADAQLNAHWRDLRARWTPEAFAELRANQRLWLQSRDHFVADGDDRERSGPGSPAFERLRTERTRARAAFLAQLLRPAVSADGSGVYGDGLGRSVRLRRVATVDAPVLFDLAVAAPTWDVARGERAPFLAGAGLQIEGRLRAWSAESHTLRAAHGESAPQELLLEFADAPPRLLLTSSADDDYTATLYLLDTIRSANAPMRELLRRLPATAYDHTEEGLQESAKTRLLLTGEYEPFMLLQQHPDRVRLRYGVGEVDVLRFAQADGAALLAVATRNVRVHTLELWQLRNDDTDAVKEALADWLPTPTSAQFFDADAPNGEPDGGWQMRADAESMSLWIEWPQHGDAAAPTHRLELGWRDGRFEAQRRPQPQE